MAPTSLVWKILASFHLKIKVDKLPGGRVTMSKTHPCHYAEQTHCRIFWRLSLRRNGSCHNVKRGLPCWTGSYQHLVTLVGQTQASQVILKNRN